jgi:hypothetical protein
MLSVVMLTVVMLKVVAPFQVAYPSNEVPL